MAIGYCENLSRKLVYYTSRALLAIAPKKLLFFYRAAKQVDIDKASGVSPRRGAHPTRVYECSKSSAAIASPLLIR